MKPKVYVTRRVPDAGLDLVLDACDAEVWEGDLPVPRDLLLEKVRAVEGLYCLLTERIDDELLDAALELRVVSNYAVGFNNIDVDACTLRGIPVGNTPGVLTDTTADFAFALLMAAARRIPEGAAFVEAGGWKTWGPKLHARGGRSRGHPGRHRVWSHRASRGPQGKRVRHARAML